MNEQFHMRWVEYDSDDYLQMVKLRQEILRTPLRLKFTAEELAKDKKDFLLCAFKANRLTACLILSPDLDGKMKMRQVAVGLAEQGQGIGQQLVKESESFSIGKGYTKIILHARETAVPFYLRLGYKIIGEKFTEVTIPHFYMEKTLN